MNFVFYYLIGLPVGLSLALLTDLGATGMWTGLCIAVFLTVSILVIITLAAHLNLAQQQFVNKYYTLGFLCL